MTKILQETLFTEAEYLDLWLLFDRHFGKKECNYQLLKEYEKYFLESDRYIIIGGDMCEFAESSPNRHKYLKGQKYTDEYQMENLEQFVTNPDNDILIYISGNHEDNRISDQPSTLINPFEVFCARQNIPFSSKNEYFALNIRPSKGRGQRYLFYLSHGMSGAQLDDSILKSLQYRGVISDLTDFIIVGHSHHNLNARPYHRNKITGGGNRLSLTTHTITGIRPGSFLTQPKYIGKGIPRPCPEGNVILRLYTHKKAFRSFTNLAELKGSD